MKAIIYFILFVLFIEVRAQFGTYAPCDAKVVTLSNNGVCNVLPYVLLFEDNFEGNSLDISKWDLPYQGVLRDNYNNKEKQWYANTGSTPSIPISNNVEVSNGTLKLWVKKEVPAIVGTFVSDWSTAPPTTYTSTYDYSSAEIDSKLNFHYGFYEMRCKIPKGKGFWPAFWMQDAVPYYNEIDVFEFWNEGTNGYDPNKLARDPNMNIHYDYDNVGSWYSCSQDNLGTTDYSANFHVFGLEYTPNRIEWFIDGVSVRRYTLFTNIAGQEVDCHNLVAGQSYVLKKAFTRNTMKIRANLAIQHNGGNDPDILTPFPSAYEIDYIRFFKKTNCPGLAPITATSINQLSISSANAYTVVGTPFNMNSGFTVPSGQVLQTTSRSEVVLGAGFTALSGCDYIAKIDPTACKEMDIYRAYTEGIDYVEINSQSLNNILQAGDINTYFEEDNLVVKINTLLINNFELSLIDNFGRTIYYEAFVDKNKKIRFDMNQLTKGIYVVRLQDIESGNYYTKKLLCTN